LFIALLEIVISGSPAIAQTDQNPVGPAFDLGDGLRPIIKIGAIYNLEGSQSPLDIPSARGAELAVQEINAQGGIDGKKIELILCDGKSDPAKVRECAANLLGENISAMMGLSDTDMVLAALPAAAGTGVPFVTSGATSPKLAEEYDGLFLACFGDNVQAAAGAEYAFNEMGLKTCALLVDGDMEYARLLAGYFRERYLDLGGEIVMESFINGSDPESLSRAVGDGDPDMIYLAAGPEEAGSMVSFIRKSGVDVPVFGGDSLDSTELRKEGMGSVVFSTHALLDENSSRTGEFARAYHAEYGYPPENAFSALGYDAVNLLADAVDRAGSGDPEAVREALSDTAGFAGVTGEISYRNGSRIPNKGVTMILLADGEIAGSEVVTPERPV
jgi:branched-chain amino acid transport system substrate-binding protein